MRSGTLPDGDREPAARGEHARGLRDRPSGEGTWLRTKPPTTASKRAVRERELLGVGLDELEARMPLAARA